MQYFKTRKKTRNTMIMGRCLVISLLLMNIYSVFAEPIQVSDPKVRVSLDYISMVELIPGIRVKDIVHEKVLPLQVTIHNEGSNPCLIEREHALLPLVTDYKRLISKISYNNITAGAGQFGVAGLMYAAYHAFFTFKDHKKWEEMNDLYATNKGDLVISEDFETSQNTKKKQLQDYLQESIDKRKPWPWEWVGFLTAASAAAVGVGIYGYCKKIQTVNIREGKLQSICLPDKMIVKPGQKVTKIVLVDMEASKEQTYIDTIQKIDEFRSKYTFLSAALKIIS